jgi:hypothetical protein
MQGRTIEFVGGGDDQAEAGAGARRVVGGDLFVQVAVQDYAVGHRSTRLRQRGRLVGGVVGVHDRGLDEGVGCGLA